jgi:hypothetical protein
MILAVVLVLGSSASATELDWPTILSKDVKRAVGADKPPLATW